MPVDVLVKAKLVIKQAKHLSANCAPGLKIRGRVRPNNPGTKVLLQRRRKGGFRRIDVDRLNTRSRFTLILPSCEGAWRIRWPGKGAANAAVTRRLQT